MTPADLAHASDRELQVMILCELHGIRGLLTAALAPLAGESDPPAAPVCEHPPQARMDNSAMGQPKFSDYYCTACAQRVVNGAVV